jgi:hypothetical protein
VYNTTAFLTCANFISTIDKTISTVSEHRLDRIVIERPRGGTRLKTSKGAKRFLQKHGLEGRKEHSWKENTKTKYFSDNLGPLRRWLRSKVGERWDDVYSELCQKLDITTLSGQHILTHVWQYVERYVVFIDGDLYRKDRIDIDNPFSLLGRWREQMYIHPDTGILCIAQKPPKPSPNKRNEVVQIDSYHQYRKHNDIWYLISFEDIPVKQSVKDILLDRNLNYWAAQSHYGRPIYACHKRHCTKKEIKAIKKKLKFMKS